MKLCNLILPCIGVSLFLTGCFSVDTATIKSTGAEHVVMNNYGWKLFDWIPLFSGNADADAVCGVAFFGDDVTMEKMQARFTRYAEGRKIETPVYDVNDTVILNVLGIPIPYVVTYKELTLSGTMK